QEEEPVARLTTIQKELKSYGRGLPDKPQILVATKLDAGIPERLQKLKRYAARRKMPFVAISAVTGEGLQSLLHLMRQRV
ncbi:MAG TPA: GTPase ObgE, partial [Acidobacteriota bacterium]|nr:GTPase ObgE [Acidobacteriota bacterium]